jgi:hypothetical protein
MARRARGKPGRKSGIHVHDVLQSELRPERPWAVKHGAEEVAARVVAHLEAQLDVGSGHVEPLAKSWKIFMGIETGADAYTRRIQKRLDAAIRSRLEADGARTGDPIMQLPASYQTRKPWVDHPDVLARAPEPEAILYGAIDENDYVLFVRLDRKTKVAKPILEELEPWKPALSNRAEIARNANRAWWETAWPRDSSDIAAPKVIGLHRTNRGRFALDEAGTWKPGKTAAVVVARGETDSTAYLCGVLNSELLDLWYAIRGRHPWDIWRDYEPKPMASIPYRRPESDERADRIADLVREIAANRRALLPHRSVVRDLGRIVKDPGRTVPSRSTAPR